eukprot:scaffold58946_cov63-Phaeocystis_antarctica.AAC.16
MQPAPRGAMRSWSFCSSVHWTRCSSMAAASACASASSSGAAARPSGAVRVFSGSTTSDPSRLLPPRRGAVRHESAASSTAARSSAAWTGSHGRSCWEPAELSRPRASGTTRAAHARRSHTTPTRRRHKDGSTRSS